MASSGKATSSAPPSTARSKASAAFSALPNTSPTIGSIWASAIFIFSPPSPYSNPRYLPMIITHNDSSRRSLTSHHASKNHPVGRRTRLRGRWVRREARDVRWRGSSGPPTPPEGGNYPLQRRSRRDALKRVISFHPSTPLQGLQLLYIAPRHCQDGGVPRRRPLLPASAGLRARETS